MTCNKFEIIIILLYVTLVHKSPLFHIVIPVCVCMEEVVRVCREGVQRWGLYVCMYGMVGYVLLILMAE